MESTIEVGFDPRGLAILDRHFERYVDDGRLAGWQLMVSRGGAVAHTRTYGLRDIEAGAPVRPPSTPHPARSSGCPVLDAHGRQRPAMYSGGGGLVCTAADYQRFTAMLLDPADSGVLTRRTVECMTRNHLPGGADVADIESDPTDLTGVGFGLGFAVIRDPAAFKEPGSAGTVYWGGAASTVFCVDPAEELTVEFYTQLIPSIESDIRPELKQLIYSALR